MEKVTSKTMQVYQKMLDEARKRKEEMVADLAAGMRKADIAKKHGISRQRTSQILGSVKIDKHYQIVSITTLPHPEGAQVVPLITIAPKGE